MLLENSSQRAVVDEDDRRLLRDYAALDTVLPVDNVLALLAYHSAPALRGFYKRHRPEFDSHQVLVRLPTSEHAPQHANTVTVTRKLPPKLVYRLDEQQYVFISQQDCFLLGDITLEERLHFQELYHDCLFSITTVCAADAKVSSIGGVAKNVKQPKRAHDDAMVSLKTTTNDDIGEQTTIVNKKFRRDSPCASSQELALPVELCDMLMQWRQEHDAVVERNHTLELQVQSHAKDVQLMELRHQVALREVELQYHRQLLQHQSGVTVSNNNNNTLALVPISNGPIVADDASLIGPRNMTGITRVSEWIGRNRYGQEKHIRDDRAVPSAFQKWDCMFDNPQIDSQLLHSQLRVSVEHGHRYRLEVPLTYAYNLRQVLQLLRDEAEKRHRHSDRDHWDTLISTCPAEYRVVLHALDPYDKASADAENQKNCVVMALHLHFVMQAPRLDRVESQGKDRWRTTLDSAPNHCARYVPDLSIVEEHYPSSLHFGTGTLLTFDLSVRVKYVMGTNGNNKQKLKKKTTKKASPPSTPNSDKDPKTTEKRKKRDKKSGIGTGNGKNCAFCKSLALLTKKEAKQISHHPDKCHALACLSNNEVDILNKLMQACRRGHPSGAVLSKLKFFFGIGEKQKDKDLMHLSDSTFLRHATGEELRTGQHVNGLRINIPVLLAMREKLVNKMRAHLDNDLFGVLDTVVQHFVDAMDGMQDLIAANKGRLPLVRQLFMDADGNSFIASKFDEQKKSKRLFVSGSASTAAAGQNDGLFFELDEMVVAQRVNPRITAQVEFFARERQYQAQFIATAIDRTSYLAPMVSAPSYTTGSSLAFLPMTSASDFSSFVSPGMTSFGAMPSFMFGDISGGGAGFPSFMRPTMTGETDENGTI